MKTMKKLFALLLALVMTMSMATSAFAADTTYTITAPATTHQYEIYQIFTGDLNYGVLSNVKWGQNGTGTKDMAVDADTLSELENVAGSTSNTDKLAVITKYADLTGDPVATITNSGTYEAVAGYYLIKDKDGTVTDDDTYTTYIVKIVGNVTISPKADGPEVEKKVKDTNDSDGTTTDWQDSADYDIGDAIDFKLTATLPSNYEDYKTYNLVFTDTFENMESIDIKSVYLANATGTKVGDFAADADYTSNIEDTTFTVTFKNLKTSTLKDSIANGYKVVVEYTAVLSDTAFTGTAGNDNSVKLTYTNDPNFDGTGTHTTGTTPEDKVVVFTYKLIVNKVDQDDKALVGAGFTLYKYDADATTEDKWVAVGKEITGSELTQFTWQGLDDGNYKLVETTTPAGYNTIDPIEFTITATHETDSLDPKLTELSTTFTDATADKAAGSITASVQNQKGTTLPTTGGMGTTMFYIIGGAMVLAAVVLLVTKKRMNSAE